MRTDVEQTQSLKQRAVKSIFWLGGAKFLGQLITWCLTLLLIRLLSPEDFGLVGMAGVYQGLVVIIYDLNLSAAIVQKPDLKERDLSTCFWFILFLSFALYGLTWFLAPKVASFFETERVVWVLRIMAIGTLIDGMQIVPFWYLSRQLDFEKRAKAEFLSNIIQGLVQIALALAGYGVWSLVIGFIAKYASLSTLIYWFSRWHPKIVFEVDRLVEMLRFSIPLTGSHLLKYVYMRADVLIIGRFLNATSLGYYRVAMDLSRIPQDKIMTIVNHIAYPTFSKLQDELRSLRHYFLRVHELLVTLMLPLYIGGVLLADELITLVLSTKWISILFPFQVFCILGILQCLNQFYFMVLNVRGRSDLNLWFSLSAAIILPVAFMIGVKKGISGVCISWLLAFPILFGFILKITLKEINMGITQFIKSIIHPIFGTALMTVGIILVKHKIGTVDIVSTSLMVLLGALIYAGYFCLFSRDTYRMIIDILETVGLMAKFRQFNPFRSVSRPNTKSR